MPDPRLPDPAPIDDRALTIAAQKHMPIPWIWEGYVAAPAITLLTGAPKIGKSTLVGLLLDRRRASGTLLGRRVHPGGTVIVSDEPTSFWSWRQQKLEFGTNIHFMEPDLSTVRRWWRFVDDLFSLYLRQPFDLLVIDSLTSFLPRAENHAGSIRRVFEALRSLADTPVGALLLHHPRRAGGAPGHASRGSTALSALVDVHLDLRLPGSDPFTRRRHLFGHGRFTGQTPPHLLIEMNPEGTDYTVLADADLDSAAFAPVLDVLRDLLAHSAVPLTQHEILDRWPVRLTRPIPTTLWRWLTRACNQGLLAREGAGTKVDAFRYLPARVEAARSTLPPAVPSPALHFP